jgi:peptide/nickel transport system substrate-binding protein
MAAVPGAVPASNALTCPDDIFGKRNGVIGGTQRELFLTLPTSIEQDIDWTGIPYRLVREAFARSRARVKVAILDCCFAGRATQRFLGGSGSEVIGEADISGAYVMTASSALTRAVAPPGERNTAFTGELLTVLRHGIPGKSGPSPLTAVYDRVRSLMALRNLPAPQQAVDNSAGNLLLARIAAGDGDGAPPEEALDVVARIADADAIGRTTMASPP